MLANYYISQREWPFPMRVWSGQALATRYTTHSNYKNINKLFIYLYLTLSIKKEFKLIIVF